MFNHPTLLYHCWKDAKRESRNNPEGGGGFMLVFSLLFLFCFLKSCFEVGGFGIVLALCVIVGLFTSYIKA